MGPPDSPPSSPPSSSGGSGVLAAILTAVLAAILQVFKVSIFFWILVPPSGFSALPCPRRWYGCAGETRSRVVWRATFRYRHDGSPFCGLRPSVGLGDLAVIGSSSTISSSSTQCGGRWSRTSLAHASV